jgi:hypothetical protein
MPSFGAARNVRSTPSGGVTIGSGGNTGGGSIRGGYGNRAGGGLYPPKIKASRANEPTETILTFEMVQYQEALRRAGLLDQGGVLL